MPVSIAHLVQDVSQWLMRKGRNKHAKRSEIYPVESFSPFLARISPLLAAHSGLPVARPKPPTLYEFFHVINQNHEFPFKKSEQDEALWPNG